MRRAFIGGVGYTKVRDHWNKSLTDLAFEAGFQALKAVGELRPEWVIVGNMFSGYSSRQEHLGALIVDGLGLSGLPAFKVEAAGASGGMAASVGYSLVRSGEADVVLVVGVEKMRDFDAAGAVEALCMAESAEYTQFFGASFTALNAMLARLYVHEYGITRDELSAFPIIAHKNAVTAEHAQLRRTVSPEDVAKSIPVSEPLRLLDCAPVGDGAAATILVSEEKASEVKSGLAEVLASAVVTNRFSLYERDDMLDFAATAEATKRALSSAGISVKDLSFVEIHDAFSVMAALSVEAMGLSRKGEGARDASKGKYEIKGEAPISTFGGLKARGHPIGATGIYQLVEAYLQLSGRAGANQVEGAKIGLTHSVGGTDATAVIHILRGVSG